MLGCFLMIMIQDECLTIQKARRGLGLKVTSDLNIICKVPYGWTQSQIQDYLNTHQSWIEKQKRRLTELRTHIKKGREGEQYFYLGRSFTLRFQKASNKRLKLKIQGQDLLCMGDQFDQSKVIKAIQTWYKSLAKDIIEDRVNELANSYGFKPNQVRIKSMRTRWGSCSSLKNLNFAWTLICLSMDLIDYVVIHELCHLKHMNHSSSFWNLVASFCPQYKRCRSELKIQQDKLPIFKL